MSASAAVSRWTWLKILFGGLILFWLLEQTLVHTGDPNFIPSLLMVGTFTVPLAFCALLYSRRHQPDVPWTTLGLCVIWGGVLGTVVAGRLEYDTLQTTGGLATLAIGLIEELAKLLVPLYFLLRNQYKSEYDGIIIGAASGAGFAALESMGYGLVALILSHGNITATVEVLLFRSLLAPAAHIAWTGLLGGALWYAKNHPGPGRFRLFIYTYIGVVILHALWDSVGFIFGYVILGVISLVWLVRRIHHAEKSMDFQVRNMRVTN
jgi:RsiW-degrading membrane proteinase PrsW (M82 family)